MRNTLTRSELKKLRTAIKENFSGYGRDWVFHKRHIELLSTITSIPYEKILNYLQAD